MKKILRSRKEMYSKMCTENTVHVCGPSNNMIIILIDSEKNDEKKKLPQKPYESKNLHVGRKISGVG